MDQRPLIEIRDWGRRPRRVALSGPIVVGRDCAGEVLLDSEVSREHLRVVPSPTALSVVDLGSSNGTTPRRRVAPDRAGQTYRRVTFCALAVHDHRAVDTRRPRQRTTDVRNRISTPPE